ncbi:DUF674 family protein [Senna tora]|uniref:DUF674 family protein n=1 Tax=Senna tora TaxID=362788 RepID=A0A834SVQ4_9FABA|nr:DUF674 family protein [Senna tora]
MASSSSSTSKVSLKLLIDTKGERVLFAEASKDFIDFLFNLLRLPIGTIIRLLTKNGMVGSLGKLYESIENLNDTYLLNPSQDKESLLKPITLATNSTLLLPPASNDDDDEEDGFDPSKLYMCANRCNYYVAHAVNTVCPNCKNKMVNKVAYVGKKAPEVAHSGNKEGFVKGVVTYMVMDDLEVQPMSTISSIALLHKYGVKEVGAVQERVVELGMQEGIKLLKASLLSRKVLTTVFLKNMGV